MGWIAPRHVGSSLTRDQTCISCIGRQILNHWTTREVQTVIVLIKASTGSSSANSKPGFADMAVMEILLPMLISVVLTLCDPMDGSRSGSSVQEILQARLLEWAAMPSLLRGSAPSRDWTCISRIFYASCIGRQVLYHSRYLGSPKCSPSSLQLLSIRAKECEMKNRENRPLMDGWWRRMETSAYVQEAQPLRAPPPQLSLKKWILFKLRGHCPSRRANRIFNMNISCLSWRLFCFILFSSGHKIGSETQKCTSCSGK